MSAISYLRDMIGVYEVRSYYYYYQTHAKKDAKYAKYNKLIDTKNLS